MVSNSESGSHLSETAITSYPVLDFLRFGAALLVVLSHVRDVFFAPFSQTASDSTLFKAGFFALTRTGQEAVMLFFVISGFLVGGSCIRRMRKGSFSLRGYAIDRLTRIYVPLLPVLVLTFLEINLLEGRRDVGVFLVNLFSLQGVFGPPLEGNGALWSLSYEVWFYVMAGALCILLTGRSFAAGLCAFVVSGVVFMVFTKLSAQYLFVWVLGALVFCLPKPRVLLPLFVVALAITGLGVFLMQVTIESQQVDVGRFSGIDPFVAVLICALGWSLLVYLASYCDPNGSLLRKIAPAGTALASFSYTLYLLHLPLETLFRHFGLITVHSTLNASALAQYFATVGLILVLCYAFYWCAERHTAKVRRLIYGWIGLTARPAASPAVVRPA